MRSWDFRENSPLLFHAKKQSKQVQCLSVRRRDQTEQRATSPALAKYQVSIVAIIIREMIDFENYS
jgi:hypothetical protein